MADLPQLIYFFGGGTSEGDPDRKDILGASRSHAPRGNAGAATLRVGWPALTQRKDAERPEIPFPRGAWEREVWVMADLPQLIYFFGGGTSEGDPERKDIPLSFPRSAWERRGCDAPRRVAGPDAAEGRRASRDSVPTRSVGTRGVGDG